jgi:hypothetical protein
MFAQKELLDELMISGQEMEQMLRDPFANYVIQTCVSFDRSVGSLEHVTDYD